jgi:hypothetical protein
VTGNDAARNLTNEEKNLFRWMLEHGEPEAQQLLPQLAQVHVLPTRCPCGCASLSFQVKGQPQPAGVIHPLTEFVFGGSNDLNGIFLFTQSGVLAGLEIYGLTGEAAKTLPPPDALTRRVTAFYKNP